MFPFFLIPTNTGERLCDNNEGALFRCVPSWDALFYADRGINMDKDIPRKIIDVTGVELMPGEPAVCLGNGEQGFACCCDECDYFLLCFPKWNPQSNRTGKTESSSIIL